jgi:uncharacterized membrane protein HdeD (DUF308 family)
LIAVRRVAEHFVAELVNQHAYGWLKFIAAPMLVDVIRQNGAVVVRHGLAVAEHNCLKFLSLVRESAGVETLCVAVLMEARHEVFEVKWTYHASSLMKTRTQPNPTLALLRALAENWWLLLIRGIVAIAFGVLVLLWPYLTLLKLTFLWGAYAIADGVVVLEAATLGKGGETVRRLWLALIGIAGILAGLLTFVWPEITAQVLLLFIASWAIITGMLQIWGALELRKEIEVEWMLGLTGLLSIALGMILVARPNAGALVLIWLIGSFAILVGCIYVSLSLWLKEHKHSA